jgi:hypothetical protein
LIETDSVSCDKADQPTWRDLANRRAITIGDVEVIGRVNCETLRTIKSGAGALPIGTAGLIGRTSKGCHNAGGGDFSDDVGLPIRDVDRLV